MNKSNWNKRDNEYRKIFLSSSLNQSIKRSVTNKMLVPFRKKRRKFLAVQPNKWHFFRSLMVLSCVLLFLLTIGITSVIYSSVPNINEFELTNIWTYMTHLDVEKNRVLRQQHNIIKINGQIGMTQDMNLVSNIDELLSYLGICYENVELENPVIKAKIHEIHDNLWSLHAKGNEATLTTKYFTQIIEWIEELKERLNVGSTIGRYRQLMELQSPFKEDHRLMVNQRYGYFLDGQEKKLFQGIQLQAEKNIELYAPMAGKTTVTDQSIVIQFNNRQLVLKNVSPLVNHDQEVVSGELIGTVAKENEVTIEYSKNGQSVNPSFYFEEVAYSETFQLDSGNQNTSFDEWTFRQLILLKCHAFSDRADKILQEAKRNGISPVILAAIMIHESAWGTSKGILEKNNPAGLMNDQGLISYRTLDEGIEATGRTLKKLIIDQQRVTVEQLGAVYCPIDATNDPMGLNRYWVPAIKQLMVQLGGKQEMGLLWERFSDFHEALLAKAQSLHQKGVYYSQGNQRGVFPYHDCSSYVIWVLNEMGLNVPLGNTETLYGLEGQLLYPINYSEVQAGDLFIWGEKGNSSGDFGHTGFFLDAGGKTIIHCTPATKKGFSQNGDVVITPFAGYYGDPQLAPVYFYRIVGSG